MNEDNGLENNKSQRDKQASEQKGYEGLENLRK
jgi:hypothetical protein